ncbi:MAG: hypothetical protein Q7K40_05195 [bacterium]|nr:hypothetical protein [bacterium]
MIIKFFSFSKKYFFPILVLSVIFVYSSIFWTTDTIYQLEEKYLVDVGVPFAFYSINYSHIGPIESPQELGIGWQVPASFIWNMFFLNIMIVQSVFTIVFFLVYSIFPKTQKFFRFFSVKNVLTGLLFFVAIIFIYAFGPSLLAGGEVSVRTSPDMNNPVPNSEFPATHVPSPATAN